MDDDECLASPESDHSWRFDGGDPYVICVWCDQLQDAMSGVVLRRGYQ